MYSLHHMSLKNPKKAQSVKSKTIIHPGVAPDTTLLFSDWLSKWMCIHWEQRDELTHVFSERVQALPFTFVCYVHPNIGLKSFSFWFPRSQNAGEGPSECVQKGAPAGHLSGVPLWTAEQCLITQKPHR